jgi:hypothetical protein
MFNCQFPRNGEIFTAPAHGGVLQVKKPPERLFVASDQPVTATGQRETTPESVDHNSSPPDPAVHRKRHGSETRKSALIAGRIAPHLKAQVLKRAKSKGWSESKTVADLVEQALAKNLADEFAVTLTNALKDAIATQIHTELSPVRNLAYQAFYSAEQGRIFDIHLLSLFLQGRNDVLARLIDECQEEAIQNMRPYLKHADGGEEADAAWPSSSSNISGAGPT